MLNRNSTIMFLLPYMNTHNLNYYMDVREFENYRIVKKHNIHVSSFNYSGNNLPKKHSTLRSHISNYIY